MGELKAEKTAIPSLSNEEDVLKNRSVNGTWVSSKSHGGAASSDSKSSSEGEGSQTPQGKQEKA